MLFQRDFGILPNGEQALCYTVRNRTGAEATFTNYGAALVGLRVPDARGVLGDVVLGFDTAADYARHTGFLGALCGRYANRLSGAAFVLNGRRYTLAANEGENQLHGGPAGFDKQCWDAAPVEDGVCFSRLSPDGEMGFPGALQTQVTYTWDDACVLRMVCRASTSADTLCNLTNHAYWNLGGDAMDMTLQLCADFYTPIGPGCLPTGAILPVDGPLDLRAPRSLRAGLAEGHPQLTLAGGYDHNFVLQKPEPGAFCRAATLRAAASGRRLEVWTDRPGLQVYSGNALGGWAGKGDACYTPRTGVALEAQLFPDAMAHPHFPSPVLRAAESFHSVTEYRLFSD